jgi:hypothetical protein
MKEATVAAAGARVDSVWRWSLTWRRALFVWEEVLCQDLLSMLYSFTFSNRIDNWEWSFETDGIFSVSSCYRFLTERAAPLVEVPEVQRWVFNTIWKSSVPLKVTGFSWQALLDRIPTKPNLFRRGVVREVEATGCSLCGGGIETSIHLLLHCNIASAVWYRVSKWLGFTYVNPPNLFISCALFVSFATSKKRKLGLLLIWHAVIWVIWKVRNDCIFNNKAYTIDEVVDLVMVSAWRWFVGRLTKNPCLWYEWQHEPLCCIDM